MRRRAAAVVVLAAIVLDLHLGHVADALVQSDLQ